MIAISLKRLPLPTLSLPLYYLLSGLPAAAAQSSDSEAYINEIMEMIVYLALLASAIGTLYKLALCLEPILKK